jgi:uncharacterized protein
MRLKYQPLVKNLKVKKSIAGLGLFAGEDIPKNTCIIEYVGRIISPAEEYTNNSKYLFEIHSRLTIDGRDRKNTARYINHSCRPNAEVNIYKNRVYIHARRKIKSGEEITYDYGKEYFDTHIKKESCRCDKCKEKRTI